MKKVVAELLNVAKLLLAYKEDYEWEAYKKEHPDTQIKPKFKKEEESKPQETKPEEKKEEAKPSSYLGDPAPHHSVFEENDFKVQEKKQPATNKDELYRSAADAHKTMRRWLDSGSNLEKSIGLKVAEVPPENLDFKSPDAKGPLLFMAPLKGEKRAAEKVEADYKGDWSKLYDVVRATIAVDKHDEIKHVIKHLKANGLKLARPPKDRFAKPTDVGYRDILLNVEYPNGHIGELQINVKPMMEAKNIAHKQYETMRGVAAKAKKENREKMTDEEEKIYQKAFTESREIYGKAWDKALGRIANLHRRIGRTIMAAKIKYFNYNDLPAYRKEKEFPFYIVDGKAKPIYDVWKFWHEATEITQKEYMKLLTKKEEK